jgi:uncharacterized protein YndB with AHSA1/START domain
MDVQLVVDIHRHLNAPRERVYQAFVDERELTAWFAPAGAWVVPGTVSIDARARGHRRLTIATYSGALNWCIDGTYTDVIENCRLESEEDVRSYLSGDGIDHVSLSIEFVDEGDGTRLEVREGPCPREMAQVIREFWLQTFSKLDDFLADQANRQSSN